MATFAPQVQNHSFRQNNAEFKYCCAMVSDHAKIELALTIYLYESVRYAFYIFVVFLRHYFTVASRSGKCANV